MPLKRCQLNSRCSEDASWDIAGITSSLSSSHKKTVARPASHNLATREQTSDKMLLTWRAEPTTRAISISI